MMHTGMNNQGMTLTELMIVAAMSALVILALAKIGGQITGFFRHTRVRQQVQSQARDTMSLIQQTLQKAKPATIVIDTPNTLPVVPNSRIQFELQNPMPSGATTFSFYLSDNVLYAKEGLQSTRVVANNVTGLMFSGDSRDPYLIKVSLRIEAPWDPAHDDAAHVSSIILPEQAVHIQGGL
jgi:prepilin-type N-terminal cleavage/methylation domain-containing protein